MESDLILVNKSIFIDHDIDSVCGLLGIHINEYLCSGFSQFSRFNQSPIYGYEDVDGNVWTFSSSETLIEHLNERFKEDEANILASYDISSSS